ncbi:hypothetical protein C9374_012719 [Naegleria lovaniensis]|uniref:Uncharacterized protein n=1 Tax=Naegleria lovaniensis TaxID=51637 RepID=A0AA88KQL8_NAELO|nr:uncharacterized protein C9374_012719 [Naegleria lovaniensis]KAG2392467.1 hypothetical protein C9374_012719 [Naegleria lovaniensis]
MLQNSGTMNKITNSSSSSPLFEISTPTDSTSFVTVGSQQQQQQNRSTPNSSTSTMVAMTSREQHNVTHTKRNDSSMHLTLPSTPSSIYNNSSNNTPSFQTTTAVVQANGHNTSMMRDDHVQAFHTLSSRANNSEHGNELIVGMDRLPSSLTNSTTGADHSSTPTIPRHNIGMTIDNQSVDDLVNNILNTLPMAALLKAQYNIPDSITTSTNHGCTTSQMSAFNPTHNQNPSIHPLNNSNTVSTPSHPIMVMMNSVMSNSQIPKQPPTLASDMYSTQPTLCLTSTCQNNSSLMLPQSLLSSTNGMLMCSSNQTHDEHNVEQIQEMVLSTGTRVPYIETRNRVTRKESDAPILAQSFAAVHRNNDMFHLTPLTTTIPTPQPSPPLVVVPSFEFKSITTTSPFSSNERCATNLPSQNNTKTPIGDESFNRLVHAISGSDTPNFSPSFFHSSNIQQQQHLQREHELGWSSIPDSVNGYQHVERSPQHSSCEDPTASSSPSMEAMAIISTELNQTSSRPKTCSMMAADIVQTSFSGAAFPTIMTPPQHQTIPQIVISQASPLTPPPPPESHKGVKSSPCKIEKKRSRRRSNASHSSASSNSSTEQCNSTLKNNSTSQSRNKQKKLVFKISSPHNTEQHELDQKLVNISEETLRAIVMRSKSPKTEQRKRGRPKKSEQSNAQSATVIVKPNLTFYDNCYEDLNVLYRDDDELEECEDEELVRTNQH